MRRMQEDVERLETLDVSGRTPSLRRRPRQSEAQTSGVAMSIPEESPLEAPMPAPEPARTIGVDRRDRAPESAVAAIARPRQPPAVGDRAASGVRPTPDTGGTQACRGDADASGEVMAPQRRRHPPRPRHTPRAGTGRAPSLRPRIAARAGRVGGGNSRSGADRPPHDGKAGQAASASRRSPSAWKREAARRLEKGIPIFGGGLSLGRASSLQHIEADRRRQARLWACLAAPSSVDLADQRRDRLAVCAGDFRERIPELVLERDGCAVPRDGERALVAGLRHAEG